MADLFMLLAGTFAVVFVFAVMAPPIVRTTDSPSDPMRVAIGNWVSVANAKPEHREIVLAYLLPWPGQNVRYVCECTYDEKQDLFEAHGGCWKGTHWMPLPEPPETK